MEEMRTQVRRVIEDPTLTYHQRVQRLAGLAEDVLEPPAVGEECRSALAERIICDMYEGNAPYRPRYLLPDYARALHLGSDHLEMPPARSLDDALWFLAALYSQTPSITGYPVFLGHIDTLLAPFTEGMGVGELVTHLRPFWRALDRMLPDAFVHVNIGPEDSAVGRAVLRLERELLQVVPNITMAVDPVLTTDHYVLDAVQTVFECAKPHFVNHRMLEHDLGHQYGVVSCYNSLQVGGGSHTLVRLNLREVALRHTGDLESFFTDSLPRYVELTAELMEARIRHLVQDARFFEHSWLVRDGLVSLDRMGAMFGIFGLAEAVDLLLAADGRTDTYGHSPVANALGLRITTAVADQVAQRPMPYCPAGGGHAFLHSQSGIDSDIGVTAGTRIPIGTEPGLLEHIRAVAPHHRLFASGVSDIVHFDDTARRNPQSVVDVIRGSFAEGMREFTFNLDSNGFVRITGYLARKSDIEHVDEGARHASTFLAAGSEAQSHCTQRAPKSLAERRVPRVIAHERVVAPGPDGVLEEFGA